MVAVSLQDVIETYQIALDVAIWVGDVITDTSLGSEVHHYINLILCEDLLDECLVGDIAFDECPILR